MVALWRPDYILLLMIISPRGINMVRIEWNEFLHTSEPKAVIKVEFCRQGAEHMKRITNFVLWIEENTGFDYTGAVTWTIEKQRTEYRINIQMSCLTTYHLKKINNKFRSLTGKLYRNNKD